jgi:TonB-linked SusC/RagA family outer membrane protein
MKQALLVFTMLMVMFSLAYAQERQVSGRITGRDGVPIPFATVQLKGTTSGTTTDQSGNFKLNVTGANPVLIVRNVGFATREITVGQDNTLEITLDQDTKNLSEVVITGALGIARQKRSVGYAATALRNEEINRVSPTGPLDGLKGRVAGADISTLNSQPGASSKIVLRGYSSLTGNVQPLFVVDGAPVTNQQLANRLPPPDNTLSNGLDFGNGISDLNPADIESVTVLKGAGATALYGSRAANGVVMITTKKGKSGKIKVEVNSAATFSKVGVLPEFQNTFGQGWSGHFAYEENGSWGPRMDGKQRLWGAVVDNSQLLKPFSPVEDNMRDFYDLGTEFNNTVSISGGNESSTFLLSLGNVTSDGIIPTTADYLTRNNIGLRASTKYENFTISASLNYIKRTSRYVSDLGDERGATVFQEIMQIPRDHVITDSRDYKNKFYDVDNYFTPYAENPYYPLFENGNRYYSDRIFGNFELGYKFTPWVNLIWRVGGDITNARLKDWKAINAPKVGSWNAGNNPAGAQRQKDIGYVGEISPNTREYNTDLLLLLSPKINDDLSIDGTVGFNFNERGSRTQFSSIEGLTIPGFYNVSNSSNPPKAATEETLRRLFGLYAQATLNYRNYLFLTLNARNDWSSTLPINSNNFFYPGANASFVLTDVLKTDPKGLSFAKIRAGYGKTGNDAPVYLLNSVLRPGNVATGFGNLTFPISGVSAFSVGNRIGNNNLKPEFTTELEIGGEFRFWDNRIGIDIAYYRRRSDGQILDIDIAPSAGALTRSINFGKIENKGIELAVNLTPFRGDGFNWDLTYTFARNRNEVLDLPQGVDRYLLSSFRDMKFVAIKGQPLGVIEGIGPKLSPDGKIIVNANNGLYVDSQTDIRYGNTQRDFVMGLVNTFSYKGLSLGFNMDYRKGGVMYSNTSELTNFVGNAWRTTYNDRRPFIVPNSVNEIDEGGGKFSYVENTTPVDYANYNAYWYISSNKGFAYGQNIIKRDFFKLRELTLSYALPSRYAQVIRAQQAQITFFGRNLWIWTPDDNLFIDPEIANRGNALTSDWLELGAAPGLRSMGVALKLTF